MASKIDMIRREKDIQDMMSQGASKSEILNILSKKYDVSQKAIQNQYYNIIHDMSKMVEERRSELRANLMARNDFLYKESVKEGKFKTALDVTVAQAKIGGLFETVQQDKQLPEIIEIGTKDFSQPLKAVGESDEDQ